MVSHTVSGAPCGRLCPGSGQMATASSAVTSVASQLRIVSACIIYEWSTCRGGRQCRLEFCFSLSNDNWVISSEPCPDFRSPLLPPDPTKKLYVYIHICMYMHMYVAIWNPRQTFVISIFCRLFNYHGINNCFPAYRGHVFSEPANKWIANLSVHLHIW